MPDFTLKNLRDVEDMAPKHGFSETQEAHFARGDLEAKDTGIAYQVVKPGLRQAFGHRHENAEEIYVVVSGGGRAKLEDEVVDLKPMDALRVAPTVARAFEGGPDGLHLVVLGPHHEGDGEIIKDFWPPD